MSKKWNLGSWGGKIIIFVICALVSLGGLIIFCDRPQPEQEEIKGADEAIVEEEQNDSEPAEEEEVVDTTTVAPSKLGDPKCEYNFTTEWGPLMLINPNFPVSTDWIATRKTQMINIEETYGIREGNPNNGAPLLDAEAAKHLSDMLTDYKKAYPGHEMVTRSCFRSRGTNCGRLCFALGETDHHSGYTCDLIDPVYGTTLDTSTLSKHLEWQWLQANSYKYGFIDRFPKEWAGGSMSEPVNIDANGTTGLYETWHYRYVGIEVATEIATGKYNNGRYDSLEHYLKASGRLRNLLSPKGNCES